MTDHLSGIDIFVAVVEFEGFARAAEKRHLTRSAVAKTISRLEQRLGVQLFHRTTRSVSLTEEGALFHEYCVRALEQLRAGEAMLESGRREVVGKLRVTMPVLFGHLCIAPLLTQLAQEHPALQLELSFSDRLADLVEDGFDLAIRNGPLADSDYLVARRIGEHKMVLCAAEGYVRRHGAPATLDELLSHAAIAHARHGHVSSWRFWQDGEVRDIVPAARLMMDDFQAIYNAAIAGMGLAWLPYWLVRDALREGLLTELLPHCTATMFAVHAVWPRTPHLAPKIRLVIDRLLQQLPGQLSALGPVAV